MPFAQFVALLRLDAQGGDGPRLEPAKGDRIARFLAVNQCNIKSLLDFVKLAEFGEFDRGPELDLVENRGQAGIVRTLAPALDHLHQRLQFFARYGAEKQAVADIVEPLQHVGAVPQGAGEALGGIGDLLQRENGIDRG